MGKLLLLLTIAGTGFVAAVVATPDDAERRAFERGYAEAMQKVQDDAVRYGHAVYEPSEVPGTLGSFRWLDPRPRWRGSREVSDHGMRPERAERRQSEDRPRKGDDRAEAG
ncbi:MAG TPA: hypothetical protein VM452_00225 [Caulifigura sp.]|jgi:hypothetical protein|nr:hypothetical protein [Caulifigura sp.]